MKAPVFICMNHYWELMIRIIHNILYETFYIKYSLDTFLYTIYLLAVHDVWPPNTQRSFFLLLSHFQLVSSQEQKLLVPISMVVNFAYSNLIQDFISSIFQYSFITSWSFCPCAISKFHPNALFIYAKAMNSNMKQDKAPQWPPLLIPFPYQDFAFVEQSQRPFKNLNISD